MKTVSLKMSDQLVAILDDLVKQKVFKSRTEAITSLICAGLAGIGTLIAEIKLQEDDNTCQDSSQ